MSGLERRCRCNRLLLPGETYCSRRCRERGERLVSPFGRRRAITIDSTFGTGAVHVDCPGAHAAVHLETVICDARRRLVARCACGAERSYDRGPATPGDLREAVVIGLANERRANAMRRRASR